MPWVQIKQTRQGTLRRAIRDADGNIVKDAAGNERWLEFPRRTPVMVKPSDLKFIASDLGVSLMPMELTEEGKFRPLDLQPGEIAELIANSIAAAESPTVPPDIPPVIESASEATAAEPAPDSAPTPAGEPAAATKIPDINTVLNGGTKPNLKRK